MKSFGRTILAATLGVGLCFVGLFVLMALLFRPTNVAAYATHVSLDPAAYANVDDVNLLDFGMRTYAYERNQYLGVLDGDIAPPQIADDSGRVPVLKYDGDIYIILHKWVNESGGLAISDDPDFKTKLETLDHCFRVEHLHGNVYSWDNDLETPGPNENGG